MVFADPAAQAAGSRDLRNAATDADGVSRTVSAAASDAAGACGDGPVAAAVDRFAAAWGGELLAWSLNASTIAAVAAENGAQMRTATGG
jgi:hypothetical protein